MAPHRSTQKMLRLDLCLDDLDLEPIRERKIIGHNPDMVLEARVNKLREEERYMLRSNLSP